ncbi:alpha/beta fold hydrolase [Fodinicola feengrottensis]|uniref:alpha/beta fold hydrolase n=1 Tax=Fodinicola feengrottensis TaxID=435914 RepID=UPI0024424B4D|nr:alpha/beta hydrolase [Fodinicola feengrottensis]
MVGPLSQTHTVIAPDLRGYGRTDKPVGGYDKRTMAADVRALVRHLTDDSPITLVGHDRGARVAHRYALDHAENVSRLAVLDIVPTREAWRRGNPKTGLCAVPWHWHFHLQRDLPELLVGPNIRGYLEYFFERWTFQRAGLDPAAVDEYVRSFSRPGALRAGFEDYRAGFPYDDDLDNADFDAGLGLSMPVLALWGATGLPAQLDVLDAWRPYAPDLRGEAIPDCGHFIAEEQPAALLAHLNAFAR